MLGAPAEISGFAAASEELIQRWLASGTPAEKPPGELQIPGTASFDPSGTLWSLDADDNGTVDIAVQLAAPVNTDLLLG